MSIIYESVYYGSPEVGLKEELFTKDELLEWILTIKPDIHTKVAFCVLLKYNNADEEDYDIYQVLFDKYSEYKLIFEIYCDGQDNVHYLIDEEITLPILLCFGIGSSELIICNLISCYKLGHFPHLNLTPDEINYNLLEADWLQKLRYNFNLHVMLLNRIKFLKINANQYYERVMKDKYKVIFKNLYDDKQLVFCTVDNMKYFEHEFPGIIDNDILSYTPLCYKLALMNRDLASYFLGFPIQSMIPNAGQIKKALNYIQEYGIDEYIKTIKPVNNLPSLPIEVESPKLYTTQGNYLSFDVVIHRDENGVYRFTRDNFDLILRSRKNTYTGELLPDTVLEIIKSRQMTAIKMMLPKSYTMEHMMNYLV